MANRNRELVPDNCHEPNFPCSSLVKSDRAWLYYQELKFKKIKRKKGGEAVGGRGVCIDILMDQQNETRMEIVAHFLF